MTINERKRWVIVFYAAAAFNAITGGAIVLAPVWSFNVTYIGDPTPTAMQFWHDFGVAVLLIGAGYWIVGRDITQNRGLVWLGIFAKLFDVATLSSRTFLGLAHPLALLPAAIDGAFVVAFIVFLRRTAGPENVPVSRRA